MRNLLRSLSSPRCPLLITCSLVVAIFATAGCATGGPNHVYATRATDAAIHDLTAGTAIPSLIKPAENVTGLAYDFNTDHLFLRIAPAQLIRVVERPSGKILREMRLPTELRTEAPADLAIRSTDRHLFAVAADRRSVMELTLFGEPLRTLALAGLDAADVVAGLAFDQNRAHLLALIGTTVRAYDMAGAEVGRVTLAAPLNAISLGFDSDATRYFVPLKSGNELGEFDASGQLVKTHAGADAMPLTAVDAGRRSLVRVF